MYKNWFTQKKDLLNFVQEYFYQIMKFLFKHLYYVLQLLLRLVEEITIFCSLFQLPFEQTLSFSVVKISSTKENRYVFQLFLNLDLMSLELRLNHSPMIKNVSMPNAVYSLYFLKVTVRFILLFKCCQIIALQECYRKINRQ